MLSPWRLRLLVHLESLGTIRAVADALNLSPSSVSQQLSVLQQESHAVLLEHRGRRVSLTPAGTRLAAHAREILRHIEAAEADLAQHRTEPVGTVRLAAFASALHALVLPAAARLRDTHPRLRITTVEQEPHTGLRALRRGEVDVAVVYDLGDGALPVDDQVRHVPLGADPIVLVLPTGHPLAGTGVVELATLAGERWVMDMPESHLAETITRMCRRAGFEPVVVGRYASYALLLQHVRTGLAVAALPALAVSAGAGVAIGALRPALTRTTLAVVPSGPEPVTAVRVVLHELRAAGAAAPADDPHPPAPDAAPS